jgi:hypothetical protein
MKHCSICCHPQRASIENALLEGKSCNKIATATGASWSAIYRHSQHLERANLHVLTEAVTNVPILDRIECLVARLESIAAAATKVKQWQAGVLALREVRNCLELLAKMKNLMPQAGSSIRLAVGIGVNVSKQPSARSLSSMDLEMQIAEDVRDATNNFNPAAIARMQRLLGGASGRLPEGPSQHADSAPNATDCPSCVRE